MPPETSNLKIAVQEPEAWSRRLSITVPADRVSRTRGTITDRIARSAKIPGFRKGRLPSSMVEKRFGPSIEQETVDRAIQEAYREALESEGLTPISQGKIDRIDYEPGQDLTFEVELEVRPELELGRVSGFALSRPAAEINDEDVDAVLERLREERGTWEAAADAAARPDYGDQVTVDITALDAGDEGEEEEGARSYRFVIGEGQAIPDVEQAILTLAPGEEAEFTVRFPDDFPDESRRGQEQRLRIKLNEVLRRVLPEIDDELARAVGEFESLDALRERVRVDLEADLKQRSEGEVRRQLIDSIVEANPFTVPNSMVERYLDHITGQAHEDGEKRDHTPEQEEQIAKYRESLRPQAEWALKRTLIVEHVAAKEGLAATQDEIDAKVEELATAHDRSPGEVWLQLEKSGQLEMLEREITQDKVFDFLLGQNTVA
jgi:trigger factor